MIGKLLCVFHFHVWPADEDVVFLCQRCGSGNFKTLNEGLFRMEMRLLFVTLIITGMALAVGLLPHLLS